MENQDEVSHIATGSESLAEFANNAGMDNPDKAWLLDSRDVWVKNPYYSGPPIPHPEMDDGSQHLDRGITPEELQDRIERESYLFSLANHEIEQPPF